MRMPRSLAMGITLHAGQLGLLVRRTLLNVDEVIRLEIFMFVSIVFTAFLWLVNFNLWRQQWRHAVFRCC